MAEALFNASGLGLPIVMTVANRAIGAPINIWNDHSDAMSMRDSGWIQLYADSNQEAVDLHIQAYRLAESLSVPVMVCMDGFVLTHAFEEVEESMGTREEIDRMQTAWVDAAAWFRKEFDDRRELLKLFDVIAEPTRAAYMDKTLPGSSRKLELVARLAIVFAVAGVTK